MNCKAVESDPKILLSATNSDTNINFATPKKMLLKLFLIYGYFKVF